MQLRNIVVTCLLTVLGFYLLSTGFQRFDEAESNPEPTQYNYAKFVQEMPLSGWIEVKGGYANLAEAAFFRLNFKNAEELARSRTRNRAMSLEVTEVYLPMHLPQGEEQKATAILHTRDPQFLKTINELRGILRNGSDLDIESWLETNKSRLWVRKDFRGMVRPSSDLDPAIATLLKDSLADEYVLVEENKKPSLAMGLLISAGGLVFLALLGFYWYRVVKHVPLPPREILLDENFEEY
jgi:hypothetical protein